MRRRDLLALAAAAPLFSCTRRRLADDAPLEMVVQSDAATIDPRYASDVYGLRISRLVHATLVAPHEETLAPEPWLASSIEQDERGGLLVTLREGARFHDGTPITANDVVETFRAAGDEAMGMPARRIVIELATIEAVDGPSGRRVRFSPKSPRAVLRLDLDMAILKAEEARRPRNAPLTGSGPYLASRVDAAAIHLTPSTTYGRWAGSAARRPVVVRTVRDEAARAMRILASSADVASNALSPPLALSLPGRSDAPAGLTAVRRPAASTTFLVQNVTRAPLDDENVRRAIGLAIDRAQLIEAKLGGAARLATGLLPKTIALAPRTAHETPFDAAAAKSTLAPLGRKGMRLSLVASADRSRTGIARAIAQMIGDAGLPVDVRFYELGTLLARLGAGDFDLAPVVASEIGDPDLLRWYLHSSAIPPRGANRSRIEDQTLDALLDRGLRTLDFEARRAAYEELEAEVHRHAWILPLWHEDHVAVVGRRASGFLPSADGRWAAIARVG
jgi:peptide/nickel transport system substrate-binding protein